MESTLCVLWIFASESRTGTKARAGLFGEFWKYRPILRPRGTLRLRGRMSQWSGMNKMGKKARCTFVVSRHGLDRFVMHNAGVQSAAGVDLILQRAVATAARLQHFVRWLLEYVMHYRNGREAKNGDPIVKLAGGRVVASGILHSAVPGNDYCNGNIAAIQPPNDYACLCDCLHVADVEAILAEKGLDQRPEGK